MAHCGPALFDVGNPGTLQTTAFVLRKEPDSEAKRWAFEEVLAALEPPHRR